MSLIPGFERHITSTISPLHDSLFLLALYLSVGGSCFPKYPGSWTGSIETRSRIRRGRTAPYFRFTNPCSLQEYFVQSVGPIKRVELSYGPNSQSRGIANVSFREADGASKAFQKLNGLLVDGRPIKVWFHMHSMLMDYI